MESFRRALLFGSNRGADDNGNGSDAPNNGNTRNIPDVRRQQGDNSDTSSYSEISEPSELLDELLKNRYDLNSSTTGDTLLHKSIRSLTSCSAAEEHFIVTRLIPLLIQSPVNSNRSDKSKHKEWLNGKTKDGMTALMLACSLPIKSSHSRSLLVRSLALAREMVDVNAKDSATGKTALMLAAFHGHSECCELLIKDGQADQNAVDQFGWNALAFACFAGRRQTCLMLLNSGSDRQHRTADGSTLEYLCEAGGHRGLLDAIRKDSSGYRIDQDAFLSKAIDDDYGGVTAAATTATDHQSAPIISDYSHNLDTSTGSPLWVWFCRLVTFPVLPFMLRWVGIRDPLAQQAWREKVGLCLAILLISAIMGFLTFGLTTLVCRSPLPITLEQVQTEFAVDSPSLQKYVIVRGMLYEVGVYTRTNSHPPGGQDAQIPVIRYISKDASGLFPVQPSACSTPPRTAGCTGAECHGGDEVNLFMRNMNTKRYVAYTWPMIVDLQPPRYLVYNQMVYDVGTYLSTGDYFLGDQITALFREAVGTDATKRFTSAQITPQTLACMHEQLLVGQIAGDSTGCLISTLVLMVLIIILVVIMLVKFAGAAVFSWIVRQRVAAVIGRASPPTSYVVCMVTCYSEDERAIRSTLDSLAGTDYPDHQKLLLVVADGMITGKGNSKSTPNLLLDMIELACDITPAKDLQPKDYYSLGIGGQSRNKAIVYPGYYRYEAAPSRRIPMLLVVKCGNQLEISSQSPRAGNRGKRDSQIILMNFFMKVLLNERMSQLEYDMFQKMHRLCGVFPDRFDSVLMLDADTVLRADALRKLVACLETDPSIAGLCGETRVLNKWASPTTMIQVYEYFLSHALGKAFEATFGGVTCLPGCFCMYRIWTSSGKRSAKEHGNHSAVIPILASPEIINTYSLQDPKTLHSKNLLTLGEDRYLTTLMLKTFPRRKLTYVPDAVCETTVPDSMRVLISQRRRWINSTLHNLMELLTVPNLCGTFCFSMHFVILCDLIGSITAPASVAFLIYLAVLIVVEGMSFARLLALLLMAGAIGLQALLVFFTSFRPSMLVWLLFYLLATPIWSVILPLYAFWHFDDFSWGATRSLANNLHRKAHDSDLELTDNDSAEDESELQLKLWHEWEFDRRVNHNKYL